MIGRFPRCWAAPFFQLMQHIWCRERALREIARAELGSDGEFAAPRMKDCYPARGL
jgi:hypothetical protein